MAKLFFQFLALADIGNRHDDAGYRSAGVASRRRPDGHIDRASVFAAAVPLEAGDQLTASRALNLLPVLVHLRACDEWRRLVDDFLGGPAENGFGRRIPACDIA